MNFLDRLVQSVIKQKASGPALDSASSLNDLPSEFDLMKVIVNRRLMRTKCIYWHFDFSCECVREREREACCILPLIDSVAVPWSTCPFF